MKTLLCIFILAALGSAAAKADAVTVVFDQPNQAAIPGETLQFFGTITNDSTATVYLNGDDPNLSGLSFTINDQFFNTVPVSLDPGQNSGDIELFDVTVSSPLLDPLATYPGTYDLLGGAHGGAQDVLTEASFSVTTVPEPSSIYLLLGVVAAMLVQLYRKSRTRA